MFLTLEHLKSPRAHPLFSIVPGKVEPGKSFDVAPADSHFPCAH